MQLNKVVKFPILGKIKVGRKNDRGLPESLEYFVATGNYENYFKDAFGEKPTSIEIMFLSDEFEDSCNERFELRQGAKLFAYGDGETFQVYDEQKDDYICKTMTKDKDFINTLHTKVKGKWETVLHMSFLIPGIRGVFGVWQLSTKGEKSSIPTIQGAFQLVKNMAGRVTGIPFDLQVKKVTSNKPNSKSKFPVINLIPNVSSGHMEKVKQFISGNSDFIGLLTENKIDDIAMNEVAKQVEYVPPDAI
jgi:hypothetical protein